MSDWQPFRWLTWHHTAGVDTTRMQWEDIWHEHVVVRGWSHIGYHAIIEQVGGVYVPILARPLYRMGSHAKGANSRNLGVALAGNFMEQPPPDQQIRVAAEFAASMILLNGMEPGCMRRHRNMGVTRTSCPGDAFPFEKLTAVASAIVERYRPGWSTPNEP